MRFTDANPITQARTTYSPAGANTDTPVLPRSQLRARGRKCQATPIHSTVQKPAMMAQILNSSRSV
ncbi:hypothetical protein ACIBG8_06630 [Nonomuraea sp. NPDC050556]|uniref:hypothetical protein n=1 Tax=Nonomuraea sp. NPDC050556 TaxID=3364369 RepID=UPI00379BF50B